MQTNTGASGNATIRTVHDLTPKQAARLARAAAASSRTPVRWILWLRGHPWHEFDPSDAFYEWRNGQQVLLIFPTRPAALDFLARHQIGGCWQPQPYDMATLERACAQQGWRWRLNERLDPPLIEADAICPLTGEVTRTAWALRDLSPCPDVIFNDLAAELALWLLHQRNTP